MKKFQVVIRETLITTVDIVADSFNDAEKIAEEMWDNGQISISRLNHDDTQIDAIGYEPQSAYLIYFSDPNKNILIYDSDENVLDFINTLDPAPLGRLIVPDDLYIEGNEFKLLDYETAYDIDPDWVTEHKFLWFN